MTIAETTSTRATTPTEKTLFEQSTQSPPFLTTTIATVPERSLSHSIVTPTLPSTNLSTEDNDTFSSRSFLETTSTTTSSTTAILVGVIVVLLVVMTLGGITCVSIILIQRRRKSFNNNNTTENRRSNLPENYEIQETDVSREYESIKDYMNMSSTPMESHENENDINLIQNRAYASVHHPPQ